MRPRLLAALGLIAAFAMAGCSFAPVTAPSGFVSNLHVDQAAARAAISAYRQAHGRGEVTLDPALQAVAQRQADAMARADQLSHIVDGALPRRLAEGGVERSAAIENVSAGYATLDAALKGWRRSPAHEANLIFGPMRRMGIAAATAPGTRYKVFWSLVMTN